MRMRARAHLSNAAVLLLGLAATAGCEPIEPPGGSYYEERIEPFFANSCVRQNGPCHVTNERGVALGNLDVTSFDALMRRRDALEPYGPYPVSLVLLKAGAPRDLSVFSMPFDGPRDADPMPVAIRTDVQHAGGRILGLSSESYKPSLAVEPSGPHAHGRAAHGAVGEPRRVHLTRRSRAGLRARHGGHELTALRDVPRSGAARDGATLRRQLLPRQSHRRHVPLVRRERRAGRVELLGRDGIRGAGQHPLHVRDPCVVRSACRSVARSTRAATSSARSRIPDYIAIADWVESAPETAYPEPFPASIATEGHGSERGFRYFVERVQPTLVRSGCTFQNCHSTTMFHDLRLRGGSNGVFGHLATVRNYLMARDMLSVESSDPNESRLIAKNLFPATQEVGGEGITHRGGPLFESFAPDIVSRRPNFATPDDCTMVDADAGDLTLTRDDPNFIHPYCVLQRWHAIEREEAITAGHISADSLSAIVYVERPSGATGGGGRPDDFDTFRPGARLVARDLGIDAMGALTALGAERDLSAGCGLGGSADIRGPAATWDGTRIGFAARGSAARGFRLYEVALDGTGCAEVSGLPAVADEVSGIRIHDFDPAYSAGWSPRVRLDARLPHERSGRRRRADAHALAARAELELVRARGGGSSSADVPPQPGIPAVVHDRWPHPDDEREARDRVPSARRPTSEPRRRRLPPALRSAHERGLRRRDGDRRGARSQLRDDRWRARSDQRHGRRRRSPPHRQSIDRPRPGGAARRPGSRLHRLADLPRE